MTTQVDECEGYKSPIERYKPKTPNVKTIILTKEKVDLNNDAELRRLEYEHLKNKK